MGRQFRNEFSWSTSRSGVFSSCPRRYFWQHYGSWGGWKAPTSDDSEKKQLARKAYCLKNLESFHTLFGLSVHDALANIIRAHVAGTRPALGDASAEVCSAVQKDMHDACLRTDVGQWLVDPKNYTLLMELYYCGGFGDERVKRSIAQTKEKMDNLRTVGSCKTLAEIFAPGTHVLEIDESPFKGDFGRMQIPALGNFDIYARIDVLYQRADGMYVIADWKTALEDEPERYHNQLVLYAIYVKRKYNVPLSNILLRVEGIGARTRFEFVATNEDAQKVLRGVKKSVQKMASLLKNGSIYNNIPLEIEAFAQNEEHCAGCKFAAMCGRAQGQLPLRKETSEP